MATHGSRAATLLALALVLSALAAAARAVGLKPTPLPGYVPEVTSQTGKDQQVWVDEVVFIMEDEPSYITWKTMQDGIAGGSGGDVKEGTVCAPRDCGDGNEECAEAFTEEINNDSNAYTPLKDFNAAQAFLSTPVNATAYTTGVDDPRLAVDFFAAASFGNGGHQSIGFAEAVATVPDSGTTRFFGVEIVAVDDPVAFNVTNPNIQLISRHVNQMPGHGDPVLELNPAFFCDPNNQDVTDASGIATGREACPPGSAVIPGTTDPAINPEALSIPCEILPLSDESTVRADSPFTSYAKSCYDAVIDTVVRNVYAITLTGDESPCTDLAPDVPESEAGPCELPLSELQAFDVDGDPITFSVVDGSVSATDSAGQVVTTGFSVELVEDSIVVSTTNDLSGTTGFIEFTVEANGCLDDDNNTYESSYNSVYGDEGVYSNSAFVGNRQNFPWVDPASASPGKCIREYGGAKASRIVVQLQYGSGTPTALVPVEKVIPSVENTTLEIKMSKALVAPVESVLRFYRAKVVSSEVATEDAASSSAQYGYATAGTASVEVCQYDRGRSAETNNGTVCRPEVMAQWMIACEGEETTLDLDNEGWGPLMQPKDWTAQGCKDADPEYTTTAPGAYIYVVPTGNPMGGGLLELEIGVWECTDNGQGACTTAIDFTASPTSKTLYSLTVRNFDNPPVWEGGALPPIRTGAGTLFDCTITSGGFSRGLDPDYSTCQSLEGTNERVVITNVNGTAINVDDGVNRVYVCTGGNFCPDNIDNTPAVSGRRRLADNSGVHPLRRHAVRNLAEGNLALADGGASGWICTALICDADQTPSNAVYPDDFNVVPEGCACDPDTILEDNGGLMEITGHTTIYYFSRSATHLSESIRFYQSSNGGYTVSEPLTQEISVVCGPGRFVKTEEQILDFGSVQQAVTVSTCEVCAAGTRSSVVNAGQCLQCDAGTYSNAGAAQCRQCQTGRYNPLTGQSECVACPPNSNSAEGAKAPSDCFCVAGFYGLVTTSALDATAPQCKECTDASETDGIVRCSYDKQRLPQPVEGIWIDKWATIQAGQQTIRSCIPQSACKGYDVLTNVEGVTEAEVWFEDTCTGPEDADGDESYEGRACSLCSDGYYRSGGSCQSCPNAAVLFFYYLVLTCLLCLPIVFRVLSSNNNREWAYFHVALIFLQFNGMLQKLRVDYTPALSSLLEFQSLFSFEIESMHLECLLGREVRPAEKIMAAGSLVLIAGVLSVVGAVVKTVVVRKQRRRMEAMKLDNATRFKYLILTIQKNKNPRTEDYVLDPRTVKDGGPFFVPLAISIFVMYGQIMYPGVARAVLAPYDCITDPLTGEQFMESAPAVRCRPLTWDLFGTTSLSTGFGARSQYDDDFFQARDWTLSLLPIIVGGFPVLLFALWFIGFTSGRDDQGLFLSARAKRELRRKAELTTQGGVPYKTWYKSLLAPFSFYYTPNWTCFFVLATCLQFLVLVSQTFNSKLTTEGVTVQLLMMFFLGVFPYFLLESFSNPFIEERIQYLQQFFNFVNALSVWNATALLGADDTVRAAVSGLAYVMTVSAFIVGCFVAVDVLRVYCEKWIKEKQVQYRMWRAMLEYRSRMVRQARLSLASQRWSTAISKARFIARMRLSERSAQDGKLKLKDVMAGRMGEASSLDNQMQHPMSWLYRDTALTGAVASGKDAGSKVSSDKGASIGVSSATPGAFSRSDGMEAVDDIVDEEGRPLKPTTEMADMVFRLYTEIFFVPMVAQAMDQLLSWAVLQDTWSNFGVAVDKAWVGKVLLKVLKYGEYKDKVDREWSSRVTAFENKLKKGIRVPILRFMIEREARADNVEVAQVLEMVDDILAQNLDPDLWNYGEAIREVATGKTTREQFLGDEAVEVDEAGDVVERTAEEHAEHVERVQGVLHNYMMQFRARRAAERVQIVEGDLDLEENSMEEDGIDLAEVEHDVGDSDAGKK